MAIWGIFIAILAQLFNGTVSVFDKFLLQKTLRPSVFAFWIALTSLSAFILLPFGFELPVGILWFLDLAAGAIFIFGVLFMYAALNREEVTRVMPIIGCFTPVFTLLIMNFFLGESLRLNQVLAIFVMLLGTFLLTYRHSPKRANYFVLAYAFFSAFGFALSSILMKEIFTYQSFVSGLAFSRLGGLIILPFVLLDPVSRQEIFKKRELPKSGSTLIFLIGRFFSAGGFILINLAYAILNPSIVNALQGVQYAYLFVAGLILGPFWPQLFNEKPSRKLLFLRLGGLIIIILGTIILSLSS